MIYLIGSNPPRVCLLEKNAKAKRADFSALTVHKTTIVPQSLSSLEKGQQSLCAL